MGGGTASSACTESDCGSHKWPCWKMPNPASEKLPNAQSYTDLGAGGSGALRDNITCLVWEKSPPTPPSGTTWYWQDNYDHCASLASSNFAGYNDWRLPTRIEMTSITDVAKGGYAPAFTAPNAYYRTGSDWYETITGQNPNGYSWIFGWNGFTSNAYSKTSAGAIARCVRGNGKGEAQGEFAVEPPNHYTIANGEVTDNYTGLTWQQGFSDTMDHASAVAYCSSLTLNGNTWRLPTINELASTVNEALVGGAINRTAFPNNPNGCKKPEYWFWGAEGSGSVFWGLSYCDGFTGTNDGASGAWNYFPTARVRCVR
jgi:hypothetical protein